VRWSCAQSSQMRRMIGPRECKGSWDFMVTVSDVLHRSDVSPLPAGREAMLATRVNPPIVHKRIARCVGQLGQR
jgi:hypothetical protein